MSQDRALAVCDAKGRDCIEKNSSKTFNCDTTCVGVYADVQWIGKNIEEDFDNERADEVDFGGKIDDDLLKILRLMKDDIKDVMKIATGKRGEELDRKKYKILISEYRKFKTRNVKYYRFNSKATLSTFGHNLSNNLRPPQHTS